jgi:kynurenine formamidase
MPLIDLSMPLSAKTVPVPGHPCPEFHPLHELASDGIRNTVMRMSLHTGTHVDAPSHIIEDGATIDEIDPDRFERQGIRLDLRAIVAPATPISLEDLLAADFDPSAIAERIVVLNTGWTDANEGTSRLYGQNPFLDADAARAVVEAGPSAIALDFAIDESKPWPNHQIALGAGIPLIENLMGLGRLPLSGFVISAQPLRVVRGDGAPARVVARIDP